mgnify:CR=1 FL=1
METAALEQFHNYLVAVPDEDGLFSIDRLTCPQALGISLHLYTYCENDGVNMVDPTGHWGKDVHENADRFLPSPYHSTPHSSGTGCRLCCPA